MFKANRGLISKQFDPIEPFQEKVKKQEKKKKQPFVKKRLVPFFLFITYEKGNKSKKKQKKKTGFCFALFTFLQSSSSSLKIQPLFYNKCDRNELIFE